MKIAFDIKSEEDVKKAIKEMAKLFKLNKDKPKKQDEPMPDDVKEAQEKLYESLFEFDNISCITVRDALTAIINVCEEKPELKNGIEFDFFGKLAGMKSAMNQNFINLIRSKGHDWGKVMRLGDTTCRMVTHIRLK